MGETGAVSRLRYIKKVPYSWVFNSFNIVRSS
jgi:hypothetical protein